MKNVITILVDSVFADCIGVGKTAVSTTPYIDSLTRQSVYTKKMYSYGPYTNAATKALFCSVPAMDELGYFFGINASSYNHYRVFKENGYETYSMHYPDYFISNRNKKYIDHMVYTSSFYYGSVWQGQLDYYSEQKKKRELSSDEYKLIIKALNMLFELWIEYYKSLLDDNFSNQILKDLNTRDNVEQSLQELENEYCVFKRNEVVYIDGVLNKGLDHKLNKIERLGWNAFTKTEFLKSVVYKNEASIFDYIDKRTLELNRKNNPIDYKMVLSCLVHFIRTGNINELRYLYNIYECRNSVRNLKKHSLNDNWQYVPSARKQIRVAKEIISGISEDKPFYFFMHFLEAHERINFFTYDIEDKELLHKELYMAKTVAENCGEDFKGSLVYQMALRYVDSCIEELFDFLKEKGLDKDTIVMIVADHGSSYTYYPIRKNVVNNFYRENYNVPMLIWDSNINNGVCCEGIHTSIEVLPTLLDVVGIQKPSYFKGESMLANNGVQYVITEYGGPGTPDMLSKDIWMSIRSDNYMVAYKGKLDEDFDEDKIVEVYDLKCDPYELNNLAGKYDYTKDEIAFLLKKLQERRLEMKNNRDAFMKNIDNLQL